MSRTALLIGFALLALLGGCGGSDNSNKPSNSEGKPTTTESSAEKANARIAFQAAISEYNRALHVYDARLANDIREHNLEAGKTTAAQFRTKAFNVDAEIRKIKFPAETQPDVNAVLDGFRVEIGDLDALAAVKTAVEFDHQKARVLNDSRELADAANKVRRELGLH